MSRFKLLFLTVLAFLCSSCGKKELDRATASRLTAGRAVGSVFMAAMYIPENNNLTFYQQLANEGIFQCEQRFVTECRPGPNSAGMTFDPPDLKFLAGQLVAGEVTGVAQGGDSTTAVATVPLRFQPTGLYARYQGLFDQIKATGGARFSEEMRQAGRNVQASFRRYDNGWRLENIAVSAF